MKTIFIGLNWLGDIIMSAPAIAAVPDEVHIVTRPHLAEVYKLLPGNLNVHPVQTKSAFLELVQALKPLRRLQADHVIVLPDSWRAAILAKACAGIESIGFANQMRGLLLDNAVDKPQNYQQMHESDLHFMLIKEAGLASVKPALPLCRPEPEQTHKVLARFGLETGQSYMVLAPAPPSAQPSAGRQKSLPNWPV